MLFILALLLLETMEGGLYNFLKTAIYSKAGVSLLWEVVRVEHVHGKVIV